MILYYYLKAICIKIEINFNVQPGAGKGEVAKKIICNISCTILTNCTYDPIYSELFMYINYISMVFFLSWNETWNSIKKVIVQFFRLDLIGNSMERFSVVSATQPAALTFPRVLHHSSQSSAQVRVQLRPSRFCCFWECNSPMNLMSWSVMISSLYFSLSE